MYLDEDEIQSTYMTCVETTLNSKLGINWIRKIVRPSKYREDLNRKQGCVVCACGSTSYLRLDLLLVSEHPDDGADAGLCENLIMPNKKLS